MNLLQETYTEYTEEEIPIIEDQCLPVKCLPVTCTEYTEQEIPIIEYQCLPVKCLPVTCTEYTEEEIPIIEDQCLPVKFQVCDKVSSESVTCVAAINEYRHV